MRVGNTFTFSAAVFGEPYKSVTQELTLNEEVYAGLFICSHLEDVTEKAVFSNVQIIIPPDKNYVPYRDYIGSHLEIMDTTATDKFFIRTEFCRRQRDSRQQYLLLICSPKKTFLQIRSQRREIQVKRALQSNNNDHVLSYDGKMLAISNHVGEKRTSTIFMLPVTGSDNPTKITSELSGHSYLHSWSPDNKKLVFTGQRNNEWNIVSIDIDTKKETNLTEDATLDDGPEYSPDGKYIYFNSVRTGTMQLWRMKPDGSEEEQVTFDEYNNWFPHFSPDGKWILYVAFPKDIDPTSHPFYKKIYLRLMPAAGGLARTIGYVYGGQGTINVPSWSPDSKKIAFVSNSKL